MTLCLTILAAGCTTPTNQAPAPGDVGGEPTNGTGPESEAEDKRGINPIFMTNETMPLNETISIYLKENPSTGFIWNATVTSGLHIENDTYIADPVNQGMAGSGGVHFWQIKGVAKGDHTFDAVYKRPWEPADGTENRYTRNITII
ncbi:MAG TPA: protease inhibitor I42 family protein [Methanospirillum sp.]|nr:protease inhibitor I42 family protein [Methanospirillum sp.]